MIKSVSGLPFAGILTALLLAFVPSEPLKAYTRGEPPVPARFYKSFLRPLVSNSSTPLRFPRKSAFWVVNFGTARTLPAGKIGFAAGLGGQVVFLGDPRKTSAFFTIPHAGFRVGLANQLDAGLRLAPIPLPFSTVGPGFGINLDAKYWLTKPESRVDLSVVLGLGGAHVLIEEKSRYAYSPNVALLNSYRLGTGTTSLTLMGRHVYLGIPTAPGGVADNFVRISGVSLGLKKDLRPTIALLPEIGAYWYEGKIAATRKAGPGFQYGLMLATSF